MTQTAGVPTVTLNDDHVVPVLGFAAAEVAPAQVEAAVTAALEAGFRLIDAGPGDGIEEAVGRAVSKSGIPRDEMFVSTKLATADQGFQSAQDSCRASLARLGLDYLDLYLIDWPAEENGKYIDAWGGMMKSKEVGDTRSIGASNFTAEQLSNIMDLSFFTPAVNQVELHPLLDQAQLRAMHAEHSIRTESRAPLGSGALLENPAITAAAGEHGKSPAQVVIRWNLQLGNIVLPGSVNPAEIAESIAVFDFELTDAQMQAISGL